MLTENYEKLHAEYLQALVEYHNSYMRYIKGKLTRKEYHVFKGTLRKLKNLNVLMLKEVLVINRAKSVSNLDKYHEQRTRIRTKNVSNNSTN